MVQPQTMYRIDMDYTLSNLQQTYPFNEMQVIAGQNGLDRPIFFTGVLDAPDSIRFVREGELVLTSGYIFSHSNETHLSIIEELHKHKAAALGIKMFRYIQDIPDDARKLADEYALPILFIPNKFSWHDIMKPLILNISAANDSTSSYMEVYNQLINSLRQSQSLLEVLSTAGRLLGYPLTAINIETFSDLSYPTGLQYPIHLDTEFFQRIFSSELPVGNDNIRYYHQLEPQEVHLLIADLNTKDYQFLILWNVPSPEHLNKFNSLMYSMILISESIYNLRNKQRDLIHKKNLLLGELFKDEHPIRKKDATALHIDPNIEYAPAMAVMTAKTKKKSGEVSIFDSAIHNSFEQLNCRYNIHACIDENEIFHFLIPINKLWDTNHNIILYCRQYGRRIQKLLQESFPDKYVQLLIGSSTPAWEDIQNKHREISSIFNLLKEKKPSDSVTHIHDLGASSLLLQPEIANRLPDFYNEYFTPLLELETNIQTNILETLKTYIEVGFSFREASRTLNIHHNTVRYRMEQFSNLTGLEITQQEDLLIILICLHYKT